MYNLCGKTINLSAQFKPRVDSDLLSRVVQNAWEFKNESLRQACASLKVTEKIVELFGRLYPASDMVVLAKYGKAEYSKTVSVRIYNLDTKSWDYSTMIELPESVLIPLGAGQIYACGPRYSKEPNYGVRPEARAKMSQEDWQKIVEHHDRADARRMPAETEIFFADLMLAQNQYRAEYRQATQWPSDVKKATGKWPTWAEIAAKFPVLGEYIRSL